MVASFYLLIIRPNRRRQAEQAKLTEALHPGVRVMLSSGIYGTVVGVGDKQATVEVAPGIELTVLKQAILQAVTPGSQFAEDAPTESGGGREELGPRDSNSTGLGTPEAADPRAPGASAGDPNEQDAPSRGPGEGEKN